MTVVSKVYIGLGSNLGDRIQNLIDAQRELNYLPETISLKSSSFFLSSPVGYSDQPDFINSVLELNFAGEAASLFTAMQKIESLIGRIRDPGNRNAPRIIDLDLLLFGDLRCNSNWLTIPHPRLAQRLFVLLPLMELNPELDLPDWGKLTTVIAEGEQQGVFADQRVQRLGSNQEPAE
ncbi:MAG: 2-amino-4-hydroxy-6-hydroxymethyldihydropteridine diphosphokinase [Gammaproteobacteria bacterium]|nr:2-amino-4-hydroxy-6-hydroxymethyldihydropteridine diphosphokinase [Gammaproteobacteria bacterium]